MTSASESILWEITENRGTAPMQFGAVPEAARGYIAAWVATIDHGCGHPAEVYVSAMPQRSAVCPDCVTRIGLDRFASRNCGRCTRPCDRDGQVLAFAVDPKLIVFASLCSTCFGGAADA